MSAPISTITIPYVSPISKKSPLLSTQLSKASPSRSQRSIASPFVKKIVSKKGNAYYLYLSNELGRGGYSRVFIGFNKSSKTQVAIKVVNKKTVRNKKCIKYMEDEIKYLQEINNVNVLKCFDVVREPFCDSKGVLHDDENNGKFYMILEFCTMDFNVYMKKKRIAKRKEKSKKKIFSTLYGGDQNVNVNDLFNVKSETISSEVEDDEKKNDGLEDPFLEEVEIKYWLMQIRNGMKALWDRELLHRDIKPENFLLKLRDDNSSNVLASNLLNYENYILKISDLGLMKKLSSNELTKTSCGTLPYFSPEQLEFSEYNYKIDLWAIGIIGVEMIRGNRLFEVERNQTKYKRIQAMKFFLKNFKIDSLLNNYNISNVLKDLLIGLLSNETKERISFDEFYKHPFFKGSNDAFSSVNTSIGFVSSNTSGLEDGEKDKEKEKKEKVVTKIENIDDEFDEINEFDDDDMSDISIIEDPDEENENVEEKKKVVLEKKDESNKEIVVVNNSLKVPSSEKKVISNDFDIDLFTTTMHEAQRFQSLQKGYIVYEMSGKLLLSSSERNIVLDQDFLQRKGKYILEVYNNDLPMRLIGSKNKFWIKVYAKSVKRKKSKKENTQNFLVEREEVTSVFRVKNGYYLVEFEPFRIEIQIPENEKIHVFIKLKPRKKRTLVGKVSTLFNKEYIPFRIFVKKM